MKYLNFAVRLFFRILAWPFFMALMTLALIRLWLIYGWNFLTHGGEVISYTKSMQVETISRILHKPIDNDSKNKAA